MAKDNINPDLNTHKDKEIEITVGFFYVRKKIGPKRKVNWAVEFQEDQEVCQPYPTQHPGHQS